MSTNTNGVLKCLFATVFLNYLVVNIDHGIMPAAIDEIKQDLNITES